jgi:N-acetylneuraminic acid mutarotase
MVMHRRTYKVATEWVPMGSLAVLSRTLLALGVALVVVSGPNQVFGQGGTWIAKAPILTPRQSLAVGVVNGIIYAVGGVIFRTGVGGWDYLPTVEAYDPSTNFWTTKAPMPTPRGDLSVGVVGGILYALGGISSQGSVSTRLEAYDPVSHRWTAKPPMPTARNWYAAGVANGILYAVGGWAGPGPTGLMEAYEPTTNRWIAKAPIPSPRTNLGVGVVNGILYAVGGACCNPGHGSRILGTVEAYDPSTNTWTTKAPMPTARRNLAVGTANQVLYAIGGSKELTNSDSDVPVNVVEAYDPTRNLWTAKAQVPGNKNLVGLGNVNGILYAVGGAIWNPDGHGYGSPVKSELDPITYAFKAVP